MPQLMPFKVRTEAMSERTLFMGYTIMCITSLTVAPTNAKRCFVSRRMYTTRRHT
ncbi:hypothetical protein BDR03DRAFT_968250 [Suillus americanus]|nr:hypothetical protein BDR03DRAFT_968250 [Suillus americanus]